MGNCTPGISYVECEAADTGSVQAFLQMFGEPAGTMPGTMQNTKADKRGYEKKNESCVREVAARRK
jgi:hypothetical protein